MRGATGVTIQPHQIPRLPHKMTRMLDRRHIWNIISNARSNRYHDPTSPNTAPATKNDTARFQRKSPKKGETSFPMRGRSEHDPSMIRPWSDHENANRNPPRKWGYFSSSPRAFSIVKYNVSRPILHSNLHQILRLPRKVTLERHQVLRLPLKVTLELHQILRLPRKVTLERHQVLHLPRRKTRLLNHHHVWNLIYNAGSNRCHHPTSPNTAPATQNDSHAWSSSHMKHHFQCAEQQVSRSNLTKYCACHEKWHCKISKKISKKRWNVISNAGPIRAWSEHDPTMIRPWKRKPQPASQVRLLFQLTTSIFYCKIQRFAPNLTFKPSPNTEPATKSDTWTSPSTAPATKSDTWTSPSTAPATKSDTRTSLLYSTWLYLTLLYLTLLDSTWLYLILLDSSWLYLILLDSSWLYLTLLDSTWFYLILLDSTWFYLTLLYSTWLYLTLLYLTLLYLTLLDSTWLYLTLLDSTWL